MRSLSLLLECRPFSGRRTCRTHVGHIGVEPACMRHSARHLRGGGGRAGRCVLDPFSLWETHAAHAVHFIPPPKAKDSCLAQERTTRTLPVSAVIGLCYPGVFLIVSHGWEFQPTPASLRTWRPRRGKGCDPGSDSNRVDLNPGLQHPMLLLLPNRSLWAPA